MNVDLASMICDAVEKLYFQSSLMKIIFISEFVTVIISFGLANLMIFAIWEARALHFNVRILLICVCVATIISVIGVLVSSVYFIHALFISEVGQRCIKLSFSAANCTALRRIHSAGGVVVIASTIFLAFERLIATCRFENYENRGHKLIGLLLTFLLCAIAVPVCLRTAPLSDTIYPYCAFGLNDYRATCDISYALFGIQVVALLIFASLWYQNVKKMKSANEQPHTLTMRFQLRENVDTTRLMLPIVAINSLFMLACSIIYAIFLPPLTPTTVLTTDVLRSVVDYAPISEAMVAIISSNSDSNGHEVVQKSNYPTHEEIRQKH
ncbi:Serpentine receptor class alpha/beta-14 [Toxocara canis]|uniref:Serpentine receptor class alpha/beta-14 n=1 Tax=Toxocara canis TaxID=6265 RepID=A0A0B2VTV2_TOXCA|nr:Serpentine receptor class alpha/beta-14 [Toxocara canis]